VPITLNYLGEGEHKTLVGGVVILIITEIYFLVVKLLDLGFKFVMNSVASMVACAFILPFALIMLLPILTFNPDFNL